MRWGTLLLPAVIATGLLAPSAAAASQSIDLRETFVAKFYGAGEVGGGGDVDGDGSSDVVTAYAAADPLGREDAGVAYAVLGPLRTRSAGLRSNDYRGFRILGAAENDNLARSCIVGDLNDDGMDDMVLGAQSADTPNGAYSGAVYVVFGSTDKEDVDLADFHEDSQGDRGYRVDGAGGFDLAGFDVACLGDVNLDGLGDFAVAAPFAGAVYVVFGKADTSTVDLRRFDLNAQVTSGFRIDLPVPEYNDGYSVGAAGDTNGDGRPDVVIGVVPRNYESRGGAYIVFGKSDPVPVEVSDGNGWGYRIRGARDGDATGEDVASAGDFNGDGLGDVIVGAGRIYRGLPGRAYVVFGSATTSEVSLRALGQRGVAVTGGPNRDSAGSAVAPAGDVDSDGYDDVLVGVPWGRFGARRAGAAYLVRGAQGTRALSLQNLGDRGYGILGARRGDEAGSSVASYVDERTGELRIMVGAFRHRKTYVVRPR